MRKVRGHFVTLQWACTCIRCQCNSGLYFLPVTSCDRNQNKLWPIWWALWLVCDLNYNGINDGVHWEISIGSNLVFLNEMLLFDFLHFMVVFTKTSFFSSHLFVHTWKQKTLIMHTVTNNNDKSKRTNNNMWWNIWISCIKIVDWNGTT